MNCIGDIVRYWRISCHLLIICLFCNAFCVLDFGGLFVLWYFLTPCACLCASLYYHVLLCCIQVLFRIWLNLVAFKTLFPIIQWSILICFWLMNISKISLPYRADTKWMWNKRDLISYNPACVFVSQQQTNCHNYHHTTTITVINVTTNSHYYSTWTLIFSNRISSISHGITFRKIVV